MAGAEQQIGHIEAAPPQNEAEEAAAAHTATAFTYFMPFLAGAFACLHLADQDAKTYWIGSLGAAAAATCLWWLVCCAAAGKPALQLLASIIVIVCSDLAIATWRCSLWCWLAGSIAVELAGAYLAIFAAGVACAACVKDVWLAGAVWLAKAASLVALFWAIPAARLCMTCGDFDERRIWLPTGLYLLFGFFIPDRAFGFVAWLVLAPPVYDNVRVHGVLSGTLLPIGWDWRSDQLMRLGRKLQNGRRLAQPATVVDRCRDGPEPEDQQAACVACDGLQRSKTDSCRVWIDRVAPTFPRGSTQLPSTDQTAAAMQALSGAPSVGCCQAISAALTARCGCEPAFARVREETALEEPTLTVPYLQGSNQLIAKACGIADVDCA
ncbi:hypothetical protein ABPG75_012034 [Micractinium tetrahymenae]